MKFLSAVVLYMLIVTAVEFAGEGRGCSAAAEDGQVLNIAHPALSQSWSPLHGGGHAVRWQSLTWAAPLYFDKAGILQPYVLDKAESDPSFSHWTLTISPKAVFSDGSPISAGDLKGTWELCAMPSTGHARADLFLGGIKGFKDVTSGKSTALSGIAVKDARTVVVTLGAPDPIFDQKIATALIAPVKISQARDANGSEKPDWWQPNNGVVVSGPFMPQSMDLDRGIVVLIPNPHFFGPAPKLKKIIITTVTDPGTATLMLKTGKMDAHTELITPTLLDDLGSDFISGPALAKGQHFWFDAQKPPMNDINVRKALIMSVNREELAKAAFPDGPYAAATQLLNKVAGVDPSYPRYPYDPAAARRALAASTYKEGRLLPKITLSGISTPTHEAAARYMAKQWREVLNIEDVEMQADIEDSTGPAKRSAQIFRDDVGTRVPDAVAYLMGAIHSTSGNARGKMGGYKNARVDELLDKAKTKAVTDSARQKGAQDAQKAFREDYMYIPYYYDVMSKWAMPWVTGFDKNDDWQLIEPWNVTIDETKR
ncbi:MAG: ABC transporter substrate-binding protein [Desulforhopalus sp.]|nr:ABC transporter substrate-binding protein [Desulforhopalus sp.]